MAASAMACRVGVAPARAVARGAARAAPCVATARPSGASMPLARLRFSQLRTVSSGAGFARRVMLAGSVGLAALGKGLGVRAMAAGAIPAPPDVAAPPANASVTPSGLATLVLKAGTGASVLRATHRDANVPPGGCAHCCLTRPLPHGCARVMCRYRAPGTR